jgi:hypothetical protein
MEIFALVHVLRDLQATHDRRDRERMDIEGDLRLARARKIEELGPVASFLAGQTILGDRSMPALRPVLAVVTESDFVLLASDYDDDVRVEYGRIPRDDVASVYVVDDEARPVSEDTLRPIDPMQDPAGTFVVVVDRHGPEDDERRLGLVVRSPIVAGEIRDRFRRYVTEPEPSPQA